MSLSKRLERAAELGHWKAQVAHLRRQPIILSDSKAHSIRNAFYNTAQHIKTPFPVRVWCTSGSRAHHCVLKLKENINSAVHKYGHILIYVWVGTCDLTRKNSNGIIALRTPASKQTVHDIVNEYREMIEVARPYGDRVIIRFLDIPVFSAVKWNRCHNYFETPLAADKDISFQVEWLNHYIRNLNWLQGQARLNFNNDLENCRKSAGRRARYTYTARPLHDGIHPDRTLAKVWCVLIIKDLLSFQN